MIKYKEYGPGWWLKIDTETGQKISFPKKHGYYKEMKAWEAEGNAIEERETEAERIEREAQEAEQALQSQKSTCILYLNQSEIHVTNDPPYPDDVTAWKTARKQWRTILKSEVLQEIPPKPF
jgi:hypothetical protein